MEIPVQKEKWRERDMQYGGVIPASGFPRDGGTAKEGHRKDDLITEQTMHLIQHMHSVHGRRLGVIPSKRAFSERFEFGTM